ncbi:MAG: hypothetical protein SNJ69_06095 [Chloroflexaceae bacterium]
MVDRHAIAVIVVAMVAWLAACGGPSASEAPTPSPPAPSATATAPPPVASPPGAAPTPTLGAAAGAPNEVYPGVPRSRTREGYHLLGNPEAPVTLVMYSDFL